MSACTVGNQMMEIMRRARGVANAVVGLLVLLAGTGARAAVHEIEIAEGLFMPDRIVIEAGDTVVWHAASPEHTVTADDGTFDSVSIWDTVPMGAEFEWTFADEGVFPYYCGLHGGPGGSGMSGVVVVSAAASNRAPAAPVNVLPPKDATGQALAPVLRSGPFSDPDPGDFHAGSQWVVRRADNGSIVFDSGDDAVGRIERSVPAGVLQPSTRYSWQVRHRDGRSAWSPYSPASTFTTLQPIVAKGVGLKASFWNSAPAGDPRVVTTNAAVDFNWGVERPHRVITADAFGTRWEGFLVPEFTERHEISLTALGQARLWIDGQLLVDEWSACDFAKTRKAWVPLVAGQAVSIRIDYVAAGSGAQTHLRWSGPSFPEQVVPTERLFPALP